VLDELKAWLKYDTKVHKTSRKLVEEFWIYLPSEAQSGVENLACSLLEERRDERQIFSKLLNILKRAEEALVHNSNPRDRTQAQSLFLLSSRRNTEIDKFINSVFERIDQKHPKKDWYDPLLMEKCLDSLMDQVGNDISKLVPYTKEMDDELEVLLDGVEVD
jgi:hypothetical protein